MKNKLFKGAIAALAMAGVFAIAQPQGHAMINGTEAYLTGMEYHDAPIYQQKVVSKHITVGYQETKNHKLIRHANLVFNRVSQTRHAHNRGNAVEEFNIRMMRNGKAYVTKPSAATGYGNPAYYVISKGHAKIINGVKVGWSNADNLYFKWSDNMVTLATKSTNATKDTAVKYNGKVLSDNKLQVNNSTSLSHANWRTLVVKEAKSLKGGRYVYNGHTLSAGTDCAGFTELAYLLAGKQDIGSTTSSQHSRMRHISLHSVKPADLVWRHGHVGMYIGHGQVLQDLIGGVHYSAYYPSQWSTALRVK
ncbi:C40 family peptidase [Periweissella cryptocerci]|nr:NlpC/P60 family protein [Periweissella cryptocerci]